MSNSQAELPPEFAGLVGRVNYVQKKNENEYSSSCPQCGGTEHEDGSFPDRFVLWRSSRRGEPFAMCLRGHCNFKWSPSKQDAQWTAEERAEFQAKRVELETAHAEATEHRLAELAETIKSQGIADRYCRDGQMKSEVQEYWERRGLSVEWQVYLKLGVLEDYTVKGRLSQYKDTAYTIPIFGESGRMENIKLRMANPRSDDERFRNLYKSGCQHLYTPVHSGQERMNKCVVLEGEVKAAVGHAWGRLPKDIRVHGVQSKQPESRVLRKLDDYEVVYLAFDPDAYRRSEYVDTKTGEVLEGKIAIMEVARLIGFERVRLVLPPGNTKFDDAMLKGYNFNNAINMAIKPEKLAL